MAVAGGKCYFEGYLGKKKDKEYINLWVAIIGRKVHIFDDQSKVKLLGSLTLDRHTKVKDKGKDKFELITFVDDGKRVKTNTFKCVSKSNRDEWHSFLMGLAQRERPINVKINPVMATRIEEAIQDCMSVQSEQQKIQRKMSAPDCLFSHTQGQYHDYQNLPPHFMGVHGHPYGTSVNRHRTFLSESDTPYGQYGQHPSGSHADSFATTYVPPTAGTQRSLRQRRATEWDVPANTHPPSVWSSSSGTSDSDVEPSRYLNMDGGSDKSSNRTSGFDEQPGVFKTHKFYTNDNLNHNIPAWFFDNCTREQSEVILTLGAKYGNVMMRESRTHRDYGSYTITVREKTPDGCIMKHYEVKQGKGFLVELNQAQHEPMSSLSEVMNYIVSLLGPGFRAMSTNDLALFGIKDPDYDRVLPKNTASNPTSLANQPLPETMSEEGYNSDDSDPYECAKGYIQMQSSEVKDFQPREKTKQETDTTWSEYRESKVYDNIGSESDNEDYVPPDEVTVLRPDQDGQQASAT